MIIDSNATNNQNPLSDEEARLLREQHDVVCEFFKRDSSAEIVNSLNTLIEDFLFSDDVDNVTPEIRVHIANNLRVVTLITKLGQTRVRW
ncbi:hypothetical protein [Dyadobacter luticola]|uniref:Uncharacterized protein n=1 Tax=Dyadobacter luticola TaxID=1979387 RepID=A0A5R9KPW5_9BACT|nr:hypothetical protein [Dyadobacter luticola]TLU98273.1 hypothetical protein FEN17_26230 [Dyadobacter luticola]